MGKKQVIKILITMLLCFVCLFGFPTLTQAAITEQQGLDVAEFAKRFIEEGNARRDEKGYPLLTYALSGNWNTCIEIRNKGYNEELYNIRRNSYYYRNGKYIELGDKWCMDCGTYVTYMLKKTLGLELYNGKEPWHVQDIYNDARKGEKSQYFEFVYSSVAVGRINYDKLQPGDVIARITSNGNHGMLYVGDGMIAHANRDMISYKVPAIFGFQVSKLNQYFLPGTVVRIMRIKDGVIPTDLQVNSKITWPDNGETMDLLTREEIVNNSSEMESKGEIAKIEESEENGILGEMLEREIQTIENETEGISGEKLFEKNLALQEKIIHTIYLKPFMVHVYKTNENLYSVKKVRKIEKAL